MADINFLFVGYLVQEPYLLDPRFPGMRLATIDRKIHPDLDHVRYEYIGGVPNLTRFLTYLPDMSRYPGYVLNGYAIDSDRVVPEVGLDESQTYPSKYEYAKHWVRPQDGLRLLGYDIVDERSHPFSILHYKDYSLTEIREHGGMLNDFALFDDVSAAQRFCDYIKVQDQEDGVIWEVWG